MGNVRQWISSRHLKLLSVRVFIEDLFDTRDVSWQQRFWAYKRGFLAYSLKTYHLNDANYQDYFPDLDYYRLYPINGRFHGWIDDKLTTKYILSPFNEHLPEYYYQVDKGAKITRLMDCPAGYGESVDEIVRLLASKGYLAAKLISGSRGTGFYKLAFAENSFFINNLPVEHEAMTTFLQTLENYILTEYLFTHKDLGKIWGGTANTVRIITFRDDGGETQFAGAYIKFGTQVTGPVDNMCAGGISAIVDIDSGHFSNARIAIGSEMAAVPLHPDTKVPIEGTLPFWPEIKATLLAIGCYIPQIIYMGFDIAIGDDGYKIIEVNSMPAIDSLNYYCPINRDSKFGKFLTQRSKIN